MVTTFGIRKISLWLLALFFLPSLVYLVPAVRALVDSLDRICISFAGSAGWGDALCRTWGFAFLASAIQVITGFLGAAVIRGISNWWKSLLPFLMLPFLVGSTAYAFTLKLALSDGVLFQEFIADRNFLPIASVSILIQVFQLFPLCLYFFWLRMQSIPKEKRDFLTASRASNTEMLRDVIWPHCRPLAALLILFGLMQGLHEVARHGLILSPVRGTGTQLVTHWLIDVYNIEKGSTPQISNSIVLAYSLLFLGLNLLFVVPATFVLLKVNDQLVKILSLLTFKSFQFPFLIKNQLLPAIILLISLLPFLAIVPYLDLRFMGRLGKMLWSVFYTLITLFFLIASATGFAFLGRCGFRCLEKLTKESLFFLSGLNLLQVLPPIGLVFCALVWFADLGIISNNFFSFYVAWGTGLVTVFFSVVTTFMIWLFWDVSSEELAFQGTHQSTLSELFLLSFWHRFKWHFLLISLFGFSLLWTEHTISSQLSLRLPSIANELSGRIEGRGTDYYEAANLILLLSSPTALIVALWSLSQSSKVTFKVLT